MQIFNGDPWITEENKTVSSWSCPVDTALQKCRLFTYKDLWNNGYFITDGAKFGGDFLVYLGDPVMVHARYIVICRENAVEDGWRGRRQDLVALCRQVFLNTDQTFPLSITFLKTIFIDFNPLFHP